MTTYDIQHNIRELTKIFFLPYLSANGGTMAHPTVKVAKNAIPNALIIVGLVQSM